MQWKLRKINFQNLLQSILITSATDLRRSLHEIIFRLTFASTASKVFKYGDFSGPYFPVLGLNTEINLLIQSDYWKIRTKKTPHLDTFHAVLQPPSVIHAALNTNFTSIASKTMGWISFIGPFKSTLSETSLLSGCLTSSLDNVSVGYHYISC